MSIPRDHHFIPVFYLKQWCAANGKLIEYSIKHGKSICKSVGPRHTGFEPDLYSFPELPVDAAQHIEKVFLQYVDDTAARALRLRLASAKSGWTPELVNGWSRFLLSLHIRHPDAMKEFRAATKSIWKKSGADAQAEYELTRKPTDPQTFDEYIAKIDPLIPVKASINSIIKAFDNDLVGNHFNSMWQSVVNLSASRHQLLTSDRPLGLYNLKQPDGILYLPISPTLLFFASNDRGAAHRLIMSKPTDIVMEVNRIVVSRARRYVYAQTESQETFIRRMMSTEAEPTPLFPELDKYK
jgi:hypothetical protein